MNLEKLWWLKMMFLKNIISNFNNFSKLMKKFKKKKKNVNKTLIKKGTEPKECIKIKYQKLIIKA